jgi:hypothetical protein
LENYSSELFITNWQKSSIGEGTGYYFVDNTKNITSVQGEIIAKYTKKYFRKIN